MKLSSLNFIESVLPSGFRLFMRKQAKRLFGLLLLSLAIYLITSLISLTPYDPNLNNYNTNSISNILGASGAIISDLMLQFMGLGSFILISIIIQHFIVFISLRNRKLIDKICFLCLELIFFSSL